MADNVDDERSETGRDSNRRPEDHTAAVASLLARAETEGRDGRPQGVVALLEQALALDPDCADAHLRLGRVQVTQGRLGAAIVAFQNAHRLAPGSTEGLRCFAEILKSMQPTRYMPELEPELIDCLHDRGIHHPSLIPFISAYLVLEHQLAAPAAVDHLSDDLVEALGADPLFAAYTAQVINANLVLERVFMALRARLLDTQLAGDRHDDPHWKIAILIAGQCFNNEYLFDVTEAEEQRVQGLRAHVVSASHAAFARGARRADLVRLAMYQPLAGLENAEALEQLAETESDPALRQLLERTVIEPRLERELIAEVPSFGEIHNGVSKAVRAQYEEHPYPRWISISRTGAERIGARLRGQFPHFSPHPTLFGDIDVLIAGCGTGRHLADVAVHYEGAAVLGIDLSQRSLAHGLRVTRGLGINNAFFVQADIASLADFEERFHVVECMGVLMLLEDPAVGLGLLVDRLHPGGVLRLGVYSTIARERIVAARRRIATLGLQATAADIKRYRRRVLDGREGSEIAALAQSQEFFALSNVRDLLFAPREHSFTLLEIRDLLAANCLRFLGMCSSEPSLYDDYRRAFPADPEMVSLEGWDAFERTRPEVFRGMYQFWCEKPA